MTRSEKLMLMALSGTHDDTLSFHQLRDKAKLTARGASVVIWRMEKKGWVAEAEGGAFENFTITIKGNRQLLPLLMGKK